MRILIIGGGLSGLALAEMLEDQGHDYMVLEARSRFGGRIMTEHHGAGYFDLGPAWFWPGQPRIAALIDQFGLEQFEQFYDGLLSYEDERGQVQHGRGTASMQGSLRLKGGFESLTQRLSDRLPDHRKRLNSLVTKLAQSGSSIEVTLRGGQTLDADQVVMALPPRIATNITFEPKLPQTVVRSMQDVATWMAGQAKAIAVYESAFWRELGLSGDAQSGMGPMVEIHDASPADGGPYALFGFIGVPPTGRSNAQLLRHHLIAQLTRLFGPQAANPIELSVKDWAFDPHTATEQDKAPMYEHPTYGLPKSLNGLWDNKLHFGGTEVAPQFGGYLEGALEAAEIVLAKICQ